MITYSKPMNNMPRRLAMALLLTTGSFASLLADNRLSIADITVVENHNYVISVKMENDADITAVQAMLELPEGMEIVRQEDPYAPSLQQWGKNVNFVLNNTRTYGENDKDELGNALPRHEFNYSSQNEDASPYDVQISHSTLMPFKGESGTELFRFIVRAGSTLADLDSIGLTNIKFVREDASKVRQDDFYAKVTKSEQVPFEPLLYFDGTDITVVPGAGQTTVEIKLRTNLDVRGINATVKLPAGIKLGGYQAMNNSDVNKLLDIQANVIASDETGTTYRMAMSHRLESHRIETVDGMFDDKVFAFVVSADDNLLDGSLIEFSDMDVISTRNTSEGVNEEAVSEDFTIIVNNPKVAVKAGEARELVDGLQAQVDALGVPQEVRDYAAEDAELQGLVDAADDAIDAAQAAVDALDAIVEAAIADGTVATPARQEAINNAAQAAQAAIDAAEQAIQDAVDLYNQKYGVNQKAFDRLTADLDRLQNKLFNAEDDIERNYPEVSADFADDEQAIQDKIDSLRQDLADKFAAMELNGESQLDPEAVKWINDAIVKLQQDVKAAQKALDDARQKFIDDKAAMGVETGDLQDRLDDLQEELDNLENVDEDMKEAVQDMIEDAQELIDAITEALEKAEDLDDLKDIQQLIDDVNDDLDDVEDAIEELKLSSLIGDLTGDGKVTAADVTMAVEYISTETYPTKEEDPILFKKMDANEDGEINVGDITAILNIALYGNPEGVAGSRMVNIANNALSSQTSVLNGKQVIALNMDNASQFVGAQMDVVLPEGMTVASVKSGSTKHRIVMKQLKSGATRIMLLSQTNAAFNAEGTLLTIELEGNGNAELKNVVVADAAARAYQLEAVAAETTGISSAKTVADSQTTAYSLSGRLMNALKKGVNIIRRADGTAKKVIK